MDQKKLEEVENQARQLYKRVGKVVSTAIGKSNGMPVIRVALQGELKGEGPKEIDGVKIQKIILNKNLNY